MRSNKIRSNKMKNKGNKLGKALVAFMLITSVLASFSFVPSVKAAADTEIGIYFNVTYAEVGDTFNATIYLDPGSDTITTWKVYNLTYNQDRLGIVNATNVTIPGFWHTGFQEEGDIHNDTGNITDPQSFDAGGTLVNRTAFEVNFTALYPGIMSLVFSDHQDFDYGVKVSTGGGSTSNHTENASITIYPRDVTAFTATPYNHTVVNLTWALDLGDDNATLCGKAGSYPTGPSDSVLYNGTNLTHNDTALTACTVYYYRIWGWNETTKLHSIEYDSDTTQTSCYTNFTFAGVTPTNASTTVNCTYDIPVNLTITNSWGTTFRYWINGSNAQTTSGGLVANGSYGFTMTGLSHNTSYWWNVTASEVGTDDSVTAGYWFRTGVGGGTAPALSTNPGPSNGAISIPVNISSFNITVSDTDGDALNTTFYWTNGTAIGWDDYTASGDSAAITPAGIVLDYGTQYGWYVVVNDTCLTTRTPVAGSFLFFTTDYIEVAITKTWTVHANNSIETTINVSNIGETNLTGVRINDTYYEGNLVYNGSAPANDTGDEGNWTIPWLNITGYPSDDYEITMWLNLTNTPFPNGTLIENNVTVYANTSFVEFNYSNSTSAAALTVGATTTKEPNRTWVNGSDTFLNFTINITNSGDFTLNGLYINETATGMGYQDGVYFNGSNVTGNVTNTSFYIDSVAPGVTTSFWIRVNLSHTELVNGSSIYNNITLRTNETSENTTWMEPVSYGGFTTLLRIRYSTDLTDVSGIGNSVLTILGILLVIAAIFMIIMVVNKGGLFGGGE